MKASHSRPKTMIVGVLFVVWALVAAACGDDEPAATTAAPAATTAAPATTEAAMEETPTTEAAPATTEAAMEETPTTEAAPATTEAAMEETTTTLAQLEPATIQFWHVYSGPLEEAMTELVARFEAKYPQIDVEAQFTGGYYPTSQKIAGAIEANDLPNLTVAFEDGTVNWHRGGVLLDLTDYVNDPQIGVDVADFLPVEIARNTYLTEGGRMLSFPWTVAIAVLFYNQDMLTGLGFDGPAETWDEFLSQCEVILTELNKSCYSIQVDASMWNATGFTFGGFPTIDMDTRATRYGEEPWTKTLDLFATLIEEGYGFPTVGRADEATANLSDFASQQVAYIVTSSRWIPFVEEGVAGAFNWSVGALPQELPGSDPLTVLFGPNAVAFNTTEAENRATWEFVKFLSSPESQAYWAATSGNLPSRLSVGDSAEYAAFLGTSPPMAAAWEILPYALSEMPMTDEGNLGPPPFSFRVLQQDVQAELLTGNMTREEAQRKLVEDGATLLGEYYANLLDS